MKIEHVRADNPGPYTLDGTMTWIIDERVVVDPGPELPDHVEAILARSPDLEAIVITHRHADHAGALGLLHDRVRVPVYGPERVQGVSEPVGDGDRIEVGPVSLEAIATPGHTGEHICYITDEGELFTGDTVLGFGTTTIFLPDGNMASYLRSLRKLIDLEPRVIYPGHGPAREDAVALLNEYLDHRLEREKQVLEEWRLGAREPGAIRARIYRDLDSSLHHAAELQISAHLHSLREEGRIEPQE